MIAEKTADAIKGRKLAPFEPPTRIATGHYSYNKAMHRSSSFSSPSTSPTGAIYHKKSSQATSHLLLPPPIDQMNYPDLLNDFISELATSSNFNVSSGSTLSPFKPMTAAKDHLYHTGHHHKHHKEFMLKRYGSSKLVDNLIKKIVPIR